LLPKQYNNILIYIREIIFGIKFEDEYSASKQIKAGVLGPILYLIYTSDIPTTEGTLLPTFADEQRHLQKVQTLKKLQLKHRKPY
jgi:hypothetical protein